tara:strand:- start:38 stop:634 length:597 start_codon:yes stop_codon:yes gene_type:complete
MNNFNGYQVVKKVLPRELCKHISNYFLLKRRVTDQLYKSTYQSPYENINGIFNDVQAKGCFSIYADINTEVLLTTLRPIVEKTINRRIIETYSYARVYERGAILDKHLDREECKFSTTLNLGGDSWPIFIDDKEVILKPGDMLVYEGAKYPHWRERFDGTYCVQAFLHYVDEKDEHLKHDGRPFLGLPSFFKKEMNNN